MIKNLSGMFETPDYKPNTHLCIYRNDLYEDYPPHWHTPMEILLPVESEYTTIIGEKEYVVQPYEILIVGSGAIHECKAPKQGMRFFFQIDVSRLKSITGINPILAFIGQSMLITPQDSPDIHKSILKLLEEMIEEYFRSEDFDMDAPISMRADEANNLSRSSLCEPIIYAKFLNILTLIGRSHLDRIGPAIGSHLKGKEYINKFMSVCRYIDAHFDEDLDLDTVADMAGFSKYHFTRLFKEFAGVTFYRYVNQQRILHAEELLADPDISITQIAVQSGFSTTNSFIRMFKQLKNCTPTEFRKIQETRSFRWELETPKTLSEEFR